MRAEANYIKTISEGSLTLDLTSVGNKATINIFDMSGRLMLNTIVDGGNVQEVNISSLPQKGIYLLQVKAGSIVAAQKFKR